ncbi:MAG: HNH/endonuclease VII fold putative polymorphic toxin [Aminipila sp.]
MLFKTKKQTMVKRFISILTMVAVLVTMSCVTVSETSFAKSSKGGSSKTKSSQSKGSSSKSKTSSSKPKSSSQSSSKGSSASKTSKYKPSSSSSKSYSTKGSSTKKGTSTSKKTTSTSKKSGSTSKSANHKGTTISKFKASKSFGKKVVSSAFKKGTSVVKSFGGKVVSAGSKAFKAFSGKKGSMAIGGKLGSSSNINKGSPKGKLASLKSSAGSLFKKGANNLKSFVTNSVEKKISNVKAQFADVAKLGKTAYNYMTKNPTGQRILKGITGTLQAAGGAVMVSTGTALCGTGVGAVLGAPMVAFGASNVVQGTANTVLAIAGSDAIAPNPLQEVTKYVGYKIAGDKGAAAAGKMYGVADFTLGCVSGGGALKYFSKVDKVGDLVNVAGKFTSGAGSLIKGTVNVVKNPGLVAKFMKQASVNSVKTLRYSTTTAASALVSSANKFATNFATTLGRIGQATKAGASEYAAATARLGITPKSPTVEGLTAAISKYKQLASGTDDVIKGGTKPPNLTPEGAGRNGAFREAKRNSGIPVSEQPKSVTPAVDKRGNRIPGKDYNFGDGKVIRDHSGGHEFPDDPTQNRGPHFNDPEGNHYDYD